MLGDANAMATVAVRDLTAARDFYRDSLGLEEVGPREDAHVALFRSGGSRIVVYSSEFAGTNEATAVTWGLGDDFDDVVAALQQAGVPFKRYDMPKFPRDGVVHEREGFKAAWFTDPDGNILHINND